MKLNEFVLFIFNLFLLAGTEPLKVKYENVEVSFKFTRNGIELVALREENEVLVGTIGVNKNFSGTTCLELGASCNVTINDISLNITFTDGVLTIIWETPNTDEQFQDCFDLQLGETFWFGGPERYIQRPLEQQILDGNDPYVIKKNDNFAVAERYWLNSKGTYIFIEDQVPLFVDQNSKQNGTVCFIAKAENPYINRNRTLLHYHFAIKNDTREAHLHAINRFLGKPEGHPNEKMVREPVWTTWAKYKQNVNDDAVLEFAKSIRANNFTGGQLEIDEAWEVCFGSHIMSSVKFPNIRQTVKTIKEQGFRVSLWNSPFVNNDCENVSTIGLENGYFVKNPEGDTKAIWWESDNAHQIDFTKKEAASWFASKIRKLLDDPGVDSFKFDAGETDYAIPPSQFDNVDQEEVPNILTQKYIETCAEFGDMIEVRSAWRTQKYHMFVRMIDKDSVWDDTDGLYTLITTLIQMNMNGYTMVLPDMIGGNGYRQQPTAELIVRWTQANALMPAMQLGYLPWDFINDKFDIVEIVRKYVTLHEQYSDVILEAMQASISNGTPVNPPIWWVDPTDLKSFAVDDEFMLGEKILVAPVIIEGATSRNIYLPKGSWKDGNSEKLYDGPIQISNYSAPIDTLPYFIKQN